MSIGKIKFNKIDLGNGDWRNIFPQLNLYSFYLIKYKDTWISSRIIPGGWKWNSDCDMTLPHSWELSAGSYRMSFENTGSDYIIRGDISEIWEIEDPDLLVKEAKNLLELQ